MPVDDVRLPIGFGTFNLTFERIEEVRDPIFWSFVLLIEIDIHPYEAAITSYESLELKKNYLKFTTWVIYLVYKESY